MVFQKKLAAVMFYAALPLLLPLFYSLYMNDGAVFPLGITILLLAFPAFPDVLGHTIDQVKSVLNHILHPDTQWNFASFIRFREMEKEIATLRLGEVLALTALAWLIVPLISSMPYLYYGFTPVDAVFESVSGWTSTGLSAVASIENLPSSIIFFRSITQWIGGLGIVIVMLVVLKGTEAALFLRAEGRESTEIGVGKTVGMIWNIYIVLTIIGIILLMFLGIGAFDSVNLSMTGIANGGFFPFDSYDFTLLQEFALAGIMFAGATCFLFYKNIAAFDFKKAFLDEEFILYVLVALGSIILIAIIGGEDLSNSILNAISAIACGGFTIGDLSVMHSFSIYILILLMMCGGMLGSTTGGLKLQRILVILKTMMMDVKWSFLPSGTVRVLKINGQPVGSEAFAQSATFAFSYFVLFLLSAGAFIAVGTAIEDSMFLVASAMGNVGLSTIQIYALSPLAKIFLCLLMYLGRIEIFPFLALAGMVMNRLRR